MKRCRCCIANWLLKYGVVAAHTLVAQCLMLIQSGSEALRIGRLRFILRTLNEVLGASLLDLYRRLQSVFAVRFHFGDNK